MAQLIQITENSRYGSDQRERVYDPELFGLARFSSLMYDCIYG